MVHSAVAGRARLKVPGLYRSYSLKQFLEANLSEADQISSVSANHLTGNVLILFTPQASVPEIAALVTGLVGEFRLFPDDADVSSAEAKEGLPRKVTRKALRHQVGQASRQKEEPWHVMETAQVAGLFKTSVGSGLDATSLQELHQRYGPNLLPESVPRSGWDILLGQLKSLPVLLLNASALLSVLTGGLADAAVIMAVVGINAAIGYVTESQAEMTIHSLKRLVHPLALVIRDGERRVIKGEDLVPGDLIVLRPGAYVAADCRIIDAEHLTIDEAALTGESLPVVKRPQVLDKEQLPLGDRFNMAYMGTLVTGGQGLAIVVGTGKFTEIGKIQAMVGEAQAPKTPMETQLDRLGNQLVLLGGAICGGVFLLGLLRGYRMLDMLRNSVSLAVAAIPEGLPAVATTTLALGVREMRRQKVLIRHLEAVETLGCVQTICLDKTGTLTFNRMSVVALHLAGQDIGVGDQGFTSDGTEIDIGTRQELSCLVQVCALCNESQIEGEEGRYVVKGSSTENALVYLALAAGVRLNSLRSVYPRTRITHRSESRNYMITTHRISGPGPLSCLEDSAEATPEPRGRLLLAVKGSPLEVLAMCGSVMRDGGSVALTDEDRLAVELANERMAGRALRVLGVAYRISGSDEHPESQGCTWLGLVGMADPLRPGVKELIGKFHSAGIDTLMITGDQVPTAYAIGKELELSREGRLEIFDSTHLQELDPEVLAGLAKGMQVFARVTPAQKLQIVRALQKGDRVVGMTGDGVNDSPALKAADIGIAMGSAGTDVAREVADVVLEDDDLETMIVAISHGRTIYSNIRKSVHFLLATNVSEIMVVFSALALGLGQPLNAIQLLWINLMSDIFPGLALALEPAEPDVLAMPPRDPHDPIISEQDLRRVAFEGSVITSGALASYFWALLRHGSGARAGTLAFNTLTSAQLFHAYSCRSQRATLFGGTTLPPNRYLNWAMTGSFALQAGTLLIPGLRRLLGLTPVDLLDRLVMGGGAIIPLIINEASKKESGAEP